MIAYQNKLCSVENIISKKIYVSEAQKYVNKQTKIISPISEINTQEWKDKGVLE